MPNEWKVPVSVPEGDRNPFGGFEKEKRVISNMEPRSLWSHDQKSATKGSALMLTNYICNLYNKILIFGVRVLIKYCRAKYHDTMLY